MDTISVGYGYPWQQQPYQQHAPLRSLPHGCYSHPSPSGYVGTGWQDQFSHFSKIANNPAYSPHPFTVKFLTSHITRHQGCGGKFREGKTPLQLPHDLIEEQKEMVTLRSPSNALYHLHASCLFAADPTSYHTSW